MLDMSSLAISVPDCRDTPLRAWLSVLSVHQYPWGLRAASWVRYSCQTSSAAVWNLKNSVRM